MNRSVALLLFACCGMTVCAWPAAVMAEQTIAVISFNSAVIQTAEAQKQLGALETRFAPRQSQLKALNDEVEALRKQLSDANGRLSDAVRASSEQNLETKERQLQRETDDFRTDSQTESQDVFRAVAQKVYAFLQGYAQQHGYSAVIERGSDAAPVVWYATGNLDITDQLVKAYNAQSSAGPGLGTKPATRLPESPAPHK
jgi:outer membrane protein